PALLGLNAEMAVLPNVAPRMPYPIPNPTYIGKPDANYAFPFVGYAKIPGRTADSLDLTDDQRALSATHLGKFLRALHSIEAPEADAMGAVADFQGKADSAYHGPRMYDYLRDLESKRMFDEPERYFW